MKVTTTSVRTRKELLSATRLRTYRRCPREHFIAYELRYRPVTDAEALRFGTLLHKALEAWWWASKDRLAAALRALDTVEDTDPYDRAKARALMVGYDARWADEPFEVLAVEVRFETELVNPDTGALSRTWRLGGKIDAVVRDLRDGRVLLVEHKTTSEDIRPYSDYWRRLRMDAQISTYFAGAKALGHYVQGCLYDVIGKPSRRPLKATPPESRRYRKDGELYAGQREQDETPEEYEARLAEDIAANPDKYFARGEVARLEHELGEHARDSWQLAQQIREAQRLGRWYRNVDACVGFGRSCRFLPVCAGEASLEDPTRFRCLATQHPELAQAATT